MPGFKNVGGPRFLGAGKERKRFIGYQKPTKKYPGRVNIKSWEDRNRSNNKTKLNP